MFFNTSQICYCAAITRVLDAKCPECGKRAKVNDEMSEVKCDHCGFHAAYDEYIEIMKSKAENMAEDFQLSWDKRPF